MAPTRRRSQPKRRIKRRRTQRGGSMYGNWKRAFNRMTTGDDGYTPLQNKALHGTLQEVQEALRDELTYLINDIIENKENEYTDHAKTKSYLGALLSEYKAFGATEQNFNPTGYDRYDDGTLIQSWNPIADEEIVGKEASLASAASVANTCNNRSKYPDRLPACRLIKIISSYPTKKSKKTLLFLAGRNKNNVNGIITDYITSLLPGQEVPKKFTNNPMTQAPQPQSPGSWIPSPTNLRNLIK